MAKKKRSIITCVYCSIYRENKVDKTQLGIQKYCEVIKKFVTSDTGICKKFKPNTNFFCERSGYWLDMNQCNNRIDKRKNGCVTCKQGKIIRRIYNKYKGVLNE